jgi:glutathione S-transferase
MALKLYIVHGSHPCATVQRALELKGIDHDVVELPPPMHAALQRIRFGARTVPAVRFDDGEKLVGSRAILDRIEQLAPEPPLLPTDLQERTAVLRAEEWGDQVFQPIARRLLWPALRRRPAAMPGYAEGSRIPLPAIAVRAMAPVATRIEMKLNGADEGAVRADLRSLPGHLDRIDGWIAEGVIGGAAPNRADLQIAPTLRLLMTIGDVRPLIDGRPAAELAMRLFPDLAGEVPAGAYPPAWLPAPAPAPAGEAAGAAA